jgi:hypothetical protein
VYHKIFNYYIKQNVQIFDVIKMNMNLYSIALLIIVIKEGKKSLDIKVENKFKQKMCKAL